MAEVVVIEPSVDVTEARRITEAICSRVTDLASLVAEAWEKRVHHALGYPTWALYVSSELGFTDREARYLIHVHRVRTALFEITGSALPLSQMQAKAIGGHLDDIRVRITAGEDAGDVVTSYLPERKPMGRPKVLPDVDEITNDRRDVANHRQHSTCEITLYYPAPSTRERTRGGLPYEREWEIEVWYSGELPVVVRPPLFASDVDAFTEAIRLQLSRRLIEEPLHTMAEGMR